MRGDIEIITSIDLATVPKGELENVMECYKNNKGNFIWKYKYEK